MRRLVLAGLAAALVLPAPAAAGGWWSYPQLDRSAAAPGQRVAVKAEVLFASSAEASDAERGGFFVYAVRGLDGAVVERAMRRAEPNRWWSLGGADAFELGPVTVEAVDANLARARASLVVPALPVGRYAVMLCTAGCALPLADIVPAEGFEVVADRTIARLVERVRRLEERLVRQAGALAESRAAVAEARTTATRSTAALERVQARLAAAEGGPVPDASTPPAAFAAGLVAGVLLATLGLLLPRRRPPPPAPWPSDEELAELLSPGELAPGHDRPRR